MIADVMRKGEEMILPPARNNFTSLLLLNIFPNHYHSQRRFISNNGLADSILRLAGVAV